jgi:uncharacterized membrane protein
LFLLIAGVGVLGVLNAAYLSWSALLGDAPTCFLNSGCDIVAASSYSRIFGIPLATFGVFFYSLIVGFALWRACAPTARVLPYLLPLSTLGFLLSLYFLYLQAFIIGAYCEYCLFSLFDATLIFSATMYLWVKTRGRGTLDKVETEEHHGDI